MTAVICRACGCGDDLGDGGYEVGFDWDRGLCAECAADDHGYYDGGPRTPTRCPDCGRFQPRCERCPFEPGGSGDCCEEWNAPCESCQEKRHAKLVVRLAGRS